MKKFLSVLMIIALICSLSACGHVHSFGDWKNVGNTSCTESRVQERTCACGEKETQRVEATGHTEVIDKAVTATC